MELTITTGKRAVFLTVIGPGAYKLLRNLLSPDKLEDKTFQSLTEVMTKHYHLAPSEIMQRYKFYNQFRQPAESVSAFVSELRSLVQHCKFGATLDLMLRDRLVCGVNNDAIQHWLLSEQNLQFDKALTIAQGLKAAAQNLREPHQDQKPFGDSNDIHKVICDRGPKREKGEGQTKKCRLHTACHRCGKTGHSPVKC